MVPLKRPVSASPSGLPVQASGQENGSIFFEDGENVLNGADDNHQDRARHAHEKQNFQDRNEQMQH